MSKKNMLLSGILVYTIDDSGNIQFVISDDFVTLKHEQGKTLYQILDHEFDIAASHPCNMGEGYMVYLYHMTYEQCQKLQDGSSMRLISYKDLYQSDNEYISNSDFRHGLTIALADTIFS